MVFQSAMNALNPVLTVEAQFRDVLVTHTGCSAAEAHDRAVELMRMVDIDPKRLRDYPHQFSGGMRQRIVIAICLALNPKLIVMDEPTTALDVVVQRSVLTMIRDVQRRIGSSLIFVTHDLAVHANLSDRLGIMYAGRLVEDAPTAALFAAPRHPYTRHLIASLPRIGGALEDRGLPGAPPNLADPPPGCRFHPRCPLAMDVCRREVPPLATVAPGHRVACFAVGAAS
jgi:peptide/nickel transport system ATP-binding protein